MAKKGGNGWFRHCISHDFKMQSSLTLKNKIMSIPVSRDAPCCETNLRFRHLKSHTHESMKYWSLLLYSIAIFTLCTSVQREFTEVLVSLSIVLERRFSSSPLFNHDHSDLFGFRSHHIIFSLKKNTATKFEDISPSRTCIPGVSPGEEGGLNKSVIF